MSDSSPLLMEMGSQVSGNGSALPIQTGQTADGAEFSGVLQSVLQKVAEAPVAEESNLQAELFAQSLTATDNAGNILSLSRQTTTEILPLQTGNSLPLSDLAEPSQGLFATPGMAEADGLTAGSVEGDIELDMLVDKEAGKAPQTALTGHERNQLQQEQQDLLDEVSAQERNNNEILADINKAAAPPAGPPQGENPVLQQTTKSLNAGAEKTAINPLDGPHATRTEGDIDKADQAGRDLLDKQPSFDTALARTNGSSQNPDSLPVHEGVETNSAATTTTTTDASAARLNPGTAMSGATAYAAMSHTGSNPSIQHLGQNIGAVTIPPENPAWSSFVGDRVQWMVGQDIQQAHIKMNPPELGVLEISIQVGHDKQTTVSFSSPHAQVRDALESATPRLREMFGENGLSLGDVNVSQQSMSQQQHAQRDETAARSFQNKRAGIATDAAVAVDSSQAISQGSGMLDLYA